MRRDMYGRGNRESTGAGRAAALTLSSIHTPQFSRGFTLVEMIVVIVITGVIAGMVAIFIRSPVQGYVDSARRAEMTDIADTALRRMARDLRTAVPNSVRLSGIAVEFLPTTDGGRYRVADVGGTLCGGTAMNDALSFDPADPVDTCFEIVGSPITFSSGDTIVIGSTQSDGSLPYKAAASGGVSRSIAVAGVGANKSTVKITSVNQFPTTSELDGHRFAVVPGDQQAVTYACAGVGTNSSGDGTGTLTRYWHYGINSAQSASPGGTSAVLANKLSGCSFVYNTNNQRNSLLAVTLTVTESNESVTLYQEIHINNIP